MRILEIPSSITGLSVCDEVLAFSYSRQIVIAYPLWVVWVHWASLSLKHAPQGYGARCVIYISQLSPAVHWHPSSILQSRNSKSIISFPLQAPTSQNLSQVSKMIYISNLNFVGAKYRMNPYLLVALITIIGVVDIRIALYFIQGAIRSHSWYW